MLDASYDIRVRAFLLPTTPPGQQVSGLSPADADISPPPGTSSNFLDPPDQLAAVYVTSALVLVLATGGLSARLFVKLFIIPDTRI